jgi:hypothetical protein
MFQATNNPLKIILIRFLPPYHAARWRLNASPDKGPTEKNVLMGFPCGTMLYDSVFNASPIKEKKSPHVLRHESVHMFHLSNNVVKNVLLICFHGGIMRRDSV